MAAIKRRRGNTRKDRMTVISEATGLAVDITGCSFVMYVTTDRAPSSRVLGENLLYQVAGVIEAPLAGTITFTPTEEQATQDDGSYFYEVVMTDTAGLTETIALDKYAYY